MSSRLCALAALVALAAACDNNTNFSRQTIAGAGQRIAGVADLEDPRFAPTSGNFLTFTEAARRDPGRPGGNTADTTDKVFKTQISELRVETVGGKLAPNNIQPELISVRTLHHPETPDSLSLDDLLLLGERALEDIVFPNDDSGAGSINGAGNTVAYVSFASNLLPPPENFEFGVNNSIAQAYIRDTLTGFNELVSKSPGGDAANGSVTGAMISSNRRFVAYASYATNVVPGRADTGVSQIYVYDRALEMTFLVSIAFDGVNPANGDCFDPVISADGRFIAFRTSADNLTAPDTDTNNSDDIYLFDRSLLTMERISIQGSVERFVGAAEPSMSPDGRIVAFSALDTADPMFRQIYALNRATGGLQLVSRTTGGATGDGHSANPAVSSTGRFIAFDTMASNFDPTDSGLFRDVYLFDFMTLDSTRISQDPDKNGGNDHSMSPSISPDEKIIAFASNATNLIPGDEDANRQRDIFLMPNPATATP